MSTSANRTRIETFKMIELVLTCMKINKFEKKNEKKQYPPQTIYRSCCELRRTHLCVITYGCKGKNK